jgi:hypothetical protein
MVKFTDEDGWDCVPELKEAVEIIEAMDNDIYEIKNCVRKSNIYDMVMGMIDTMEYAVEELKGIDTDIEWIEKDPNED